MLVVSVGVGVHVNVSRQCGVSHFFIISRLSQSSIVGVYSLRRDPQCPRLRHNVLPKKHDLNVNHTINTGP